MAKVGSAVIIDTNCAPSLNRLAREHMKLKLLVDIRRDLMVCEIEGWDKMEYINELKELINSFEQTDVYDYKGNGKWERSE